MATNKVTIADLLSLSSTLEALSDTSRLDVEVLLCHVLGKPRSYLFTWPEQTIAPELYQSFQTLLKRRHSGEPVAHILGRQEFWSLELQVNASTLIPRPETELLVETALELMQTKEARVLDLGTGTGAIALALASERSNWQILAVDVVPQALELAESNRKNLGFDNVSLMQSNWFDAIPLQGFDLIVANPPYIDTHDIHLTQGDVRFEPASALVAERNGLADIETIVRGAAVYLSTGGYLLIEHGFDQGAAVRSLLEEAGYAEVRTQADLNGRQRLSLARRQKD